MEQAALDEGQGLLGSPGIVAGLGLGLSRLEDHGFDAANGRLGWLGGGQRIADVGPSRDGNARLAFLPQRQEAPPSWGLVGKTRYSQGYAAPLGANLPRSVFTKRDSFPLDEISRSTAE